MNKNILLTLVAIGSLSLFGWGCAEQQAEAPEDQQPALEESTPGTTAEDTQLEQVQDNAATDTSSTTPTQEETKPTVTTKPGSVITAPKPAANKPPETKAVVNTVSITASAFSPQVIAGKEGDTVRWVNNDSKPHTTASDGSLLWDSGSLQPGASYSRVFKAVGTYPYHDGSTGMKGTVIIR